MGNQERGDARPVHAALLHSGTEEFLAGALGFVDEGLAADEAVLIGLPEPATGLLRERMNGQAKDVTWADMGQVGANPARIISWMRSFAAQRPGLPVRCLQQSSWEERTVSERCEIMRHEALVNLAFADDPVRILCTFDTARLSPDVIRSVGATHPVLMRNGGTAPSPAYHAGDGITLPTGCDLPLSRPPAGAAVLEYHTELNAVRAFATGQATAAGLAADRVVDLVLAVGELAANTYRYSPAGGRLSIWRAAGEVIAQIEDQGHIADPLAGRHQVAMDAGGGHGLWLVHQVCDLVELRTGPGSTVIRLHMRLNV